MVQTKNAYEHDIPCMAQDQEDTHYLKQKLINYLLYRRTEGCNKYIKIDENKKWNYSEETRTVVQKLFNGYLRYLLPLNTHNYYTEEANGKKVKVPDFKCIQKSTYLVLHTKSVSLLCIPPTNRRQSIIALCIPPTNRRQSIIAQNNSLKHSYKCAAMMTTTLHVVYKCGGNDDNMYVV